MILVDACMDHLFRIDLQPSQLGVAHVAKAHAGPVERLLVKDAVHCATYMDGDEVVMISGIHEYEEHGEAWTFLCANVGTRMLTVMRTVVGYLLKFSLTGKPVYATVEPGNDDCERWFSMLGFRKTTEDGVWCFTLEE